MRGQFLGLVGLVLVSAIGGGTLALYRIPFVSSDVIVHRSVQAIPPELPDCLPPLENPLLKARVESGETTYFAVGGYRHQTYVQVLLVRHQGKCYSPQSKTTKLPANFLGAFISVPLAQEIWLQIYRENIQQIGDKTTFQQQFDQTVAQFSSDRTAYLSPEQAWALKQLGIQIPPQVQVITAQDYLKLLEQRALEGKKYSL